MSKSSIVGIMLLLIVSCARSSTSPLDEPKLSMASLSGNWDIVSFDGFYPDRLDYEGKRSAYFDISDEQISFKMMCNHSGVFALLTEDARLIRNPDKPSHGITSMGCQYAQKEQNFIKLIYSSPVMELLPEGQLRLSTKDHEAFLEQADRRRLENAPSDISDIEGEWNVALFHDDDVWIGSRYAKKKVVISKNRIQYANCYPYLKELKVSNAAQLDGNPIISSDADDEETCSSNTQAELAIIALLQKGPELEWTTINDLRISKSDKYVVLTKSEDW